LFPLCTYILDLRTLHTWVCLGLLIVANTTGANIWKPLSFLNKKKVVSSLGNTDAFRHEYVYSYGQPSNFSAHSVRSHQQVFGHLFNLFFGCPGTSLILTHSSLSSLSPPSHSLLTCIVSCTCFFKSFFVVRSSSSLAFLCSFHSCFVSAFAYGYYNWLMFYEVGLAIALQSLCFGFYLWLEQSQLDFCWHCFDFNDSCNSQLMFCEFLLLSIFWWLLSFQLQVL
jgi:hypothetical protein